MAALLGGTNVLIVHVLHVTIVKCRRAGGGNLSFKRGNNSLLSLLYKGHVYKEEGESSIPVENGSVHSKMNVSDVRRRSRFFMLSFGDGSDDSGVGGAVGFRRTGRDSQGRVGRCDIMARSDQRWRS